MALGTQYLLIVLIWIVVVNCEFQNFNYQNVLYPSTTSISFGTTMHFTSDILSVGYPIPPTGKVIVYSCAPASSNCTYLQTLAPPSATDSFGTVMSGSDEHLVVGDGLNSLYHFYRLSNGLYNYVQNISSTSFSPSSISVSGNTTVIASNFGPWIYEFDTVAGMWVMQFNSTKGSSSFPLAVAVSGNRIALAQLNQKVTLYERTYASGWAYYANATKGSFNMVVFAETNNEIIFLASASSFTVYQVSFSTLATGSQNTTVLPTSMTSPYTTTTATFAGDKYITGLYSKTISGNMYLFVSVSGLTTPINSVDIKGATGTTGGVFMYQYVTGGLSGPLVLSSLYYPGNPAPGLSSLGTSGTWNFGSAVVADDNRLVIGMRGDIDYAGSAVFIWDNSCDPFTTSCYKTNAADLYGDGCGSSDKCCTVSTFYSTAFSTDYCRSSQNETQSCNQFICPSLIVPVPVPAPTTNSPNPDTSSSPSPDTYTPSSNPEANTPSTDPPSTNPPSTNPPSTNPPSTNPPSTNPPSTNPPSSPASSKSGLSFILLSLVCLLAYFQ